jgi:coatomer subunit zeta
LSVENVSIFYFFFLLTAEIVMFDGQIVVYKFIQDLHFFVTGGEEDNELILASVLQGFSDAVDLLLRL